MTGRVAGLKGWLKDHSVEIVLVAVVIPLLGYIGNDKLSSLDKKYDDFKKQVETINSDFKKQLETTNREFNTRLETTNCELNSLATRYRLEDFEAAFLGRTLQTLSQTSREMDRIKSFKDTIPQLGTCPGAKELQARIDHLYNGLTNFIGGNLDGAIAQFNELPSDRAITHQLLGTANYEKSLLFDPNSADAKKYRLGAENQSQEFIDLAGRELGGVVKQADIARYNCNIKSRRTVDAAASERAIQCLQDLRDKKFADYSTYYNLAAISSRLGRCKVAIDYLKQAAQEDLAHSITRSKISHDEDFGPMSKSSECSSEWESVLMLFH